jgi:hypothetical protein
VKLYVYEVESHKIINEYEGNSNAECEKKMSADYEGWGDGDWNDAGLANTYSTAFGATDGLHY